MMKKEGINMNLTPKKQLFVDTAAEMFGDGAVITNAQVKESAVKAKIGFPGWFRKDYSIGPNGIIFTKPARKPNFCFYS